MNITEKLILSKQTNAIYFFRDGMFVQLFRVSLYLAVEHLGLEIKIVGQRYKSLNNQLILRAGLPIKTLQKNFPDIISTEFGYQLNGDWPVIDYSRWYQQQRLLALQRNGDLLSLF